jgi:hypothetical protein
MVDTNAAIPTAAEIYAQTSEAAFGAPIISNAFRGFLVEKIVDTALSPNNWRMCSGDWGGWDFEHADGCRLEVKQSAALQTWAAAAKSTPRFDIRSRTGYYESGTKWVARPGRCADIYVCAYHPVVDASAEHRDPSQWQFYVVAADRLPNQKTIALSILSLLTEPLTWADLSNAVEKLRMAIRPAVQLTA